MVERNGHSPYLTVEEVAERYHVSTKWVHERCRLRELPHRRLSGTRRLLFLEAELQAYDEGCPLVVSELPRSGRVVKPGVVA
jgi:predicted DNA-binding transcriptional regulator AlpA